MEKPDFNVVTECGDLKRTIYRYDDMCYIGCFEGTYNETIAAIEKKYSGIDRDVYIGKIDKLYGNTLSNNMVDIDNNACLLLATQHGHLDVIEWLVLQGVDVTARDNQALIDVIHNDRLDIVKLLVAHGADVTAQDNLALVQASARGDLQVVKWLTIHGADVAAQDNYALKLARWYKHRKIVDWITDYMETKKKKQ